MRTLRRNLFRTSMLGCALALSLSATGASAQDRTYDFDIPRENLTKALREFALASGKQIIFRNEVVGERVAPTLKGRFTAEAALARLLEGSDLTAQSTETGGLMIRRATDRGATQGVSRPQPYPASAVVQTAAYSDQSSQAVVAAPQSPSARPAPTAVGEVVVTGSRVITNGNGAPTPVTVMNLEQMSATKPDTVFEQLRDLPAFDGSGGASGMPTRGVFADSNSGASALNLRGLGANRALVLFDGHRVPPSTPTGEVDINLMPQMLMQRVEVVTGGASAVYGSDAVSGVLNFIIDRRSNGLKFEVQAGQSSRSDDASYSVGIAGGADLFGGRGHFEASFQDNRDDGLSNYLKRPSLFDWTLQGDGSKDHPYFAVQGVTLGNFSFGGQIQGFGPTPFQGYNFARNGILTPRVEGSTAGIVLDGQEIGGDGANVTVTSLKAETRLDQFFARVDYDVTDNIHAFANVSAANDHSRAGSMPTLDFFLDISTCNAFLAQQYQAAFGCTNPSDTTQQLETFSLNKLPDPRFNALKSTYTTVDQRNYSFVGGLEGKLPGDYHWDATYTFGETKQHVRNDGIDMDQRFFAALDAVVDPKSGKIVCNITLTNPTLQPGCVPINLFGPSAESKEAVSYSFGQVERWTTTTQHDLSATLRGAPLKDWAGPVDMALSGEFRRQTMELTSNTPTAPVDCTGIRFDCVDGAVFTYGNVIQGLPRVEQNTSEAALEVNVPLISQAPFVKSLDLNAAGRRTHYDSRGNGVSTSLDATTWKVGLVWNVSDELTLRLGRSRDIRAPNLWELFNPLASTASTPGAVDYLTGNDLNAQLAPQQSGGNPYLRPEQGLTTTVGMVWKPTPSFSLAIDGYAIDLKQAIAVAQGANQANQLACYASGGASPACLLQVRALGNYTNTTAANYVTKWLNQDINIGSLAASGVDVEANYRSELADHALSFRGLVSYKPHMIYKQPGLTTIDQAGSAYCNCGVGVLLPNPEWRAQVFANYDITDSLVVSVSERWRSAMHYQGDRSKIEVGGGVPDYYTTNLSLTYKLPFENGRYSAYLNVQNLFDKLAPPVGTSDGLPGDFGSYALGDDFMGRYFTVGLRGRW